MEVWYGATQKLKKRNVPPLCLLPSDVNECLNQTACGRGRCVNTEGSYRCNCFQGYEVSPDNICQGSDRPGGSYQSPRPGRRSPADPISHSVKKGYKQSRWFVFVMLSPSPVPTPPSVSFLQMWTSACSPGSVPTAAVSTWKAPTDAPVTTATK